MVKTKTPICDFNQLAIDFNLEGVDGILIGGSSINLEEFIQIIKS